MATVDRSGSWGALLVVLLLAVVTTMASAACSYSVDLAPCAVTCQRTSDCPGDLACLAGRCQGGSVDRCGTDARSGDDVGAGGTSGSGSGGSPGNGGSGGVGAGGASACGNCGMNTVCCPAPQRCAGMCVPDCRGIATGCQSGEACNPATGVCQPSSPMGAGGTGAGGSSGAGGSPGAGGAGGASGPDGPPPPRDGPTCGSGVCMPNQVCCAAPLGCANTCVPDCRMPGVPACMNNLMCKQSTGVCTPAGM